jgi:hypothetical protein
MALRTGDPKTCQKKNFPILHSVCKNCKNYKNCMAEYNKTESPLAWVWPPSQTTFDVPKVVDVEHEHAALKHAGKHLDRDVLAKIMPILEELGFSRRSGLSESDMTSTASWYLKRGSKKHRAVSIQRADIRIRMLFPKTNFAAVKEIAGFKYRKGGSTYIDLPAKSLHRLKEALLTIISKTEFE